MSVSQHEILSYYKEIRDQLDVEELSEKEREVFQISKTLIHLGIKVLIRSVAKAGGEKSSYQFIDQCVYHKLGYDIVPGAPIIYDKDPKEDFIPQYGWKSSLVQVIEINSDLTEGFILLDTQNTRYLITWGNHYPIHIPSKLKEVEIREFNKKRFEIFPDGFIKEMHP